MPRISLRPSARLAAVALLGLAACSIGVRPASAMGCHPVEKPTLGLSTPWDEPGTSALGMTDRPDRSPLVDRMPCPAERPGSPERLTPGAQAILTSRIGSEDAIRSRRWIEPDSAVLAIHTPTAPDRPPRSPGADALP